MDNKCNYDSECQLDSNSGNLYLGLDLSTQQLKGVAVTQDLEIAYEANVIFDSDLPEFRTQGGVERHPESKDVVTANPIMWIKALDVILDKLKVTGMDFQRVIAIGGSGQQHGSVWWRKNSCFKLKNLNSEKFLHQELSNCFSTRNSPVWMDSSTSLECSQLESAVGGSKVMAQITGSRAFERFTGSQIMKMKKTKPEIYSTTEKISLVSSFLASIFLGNYAPIDISDASGMNMMNIKSKEWDMKILQAIVSTDQEQDEEKGKEDNSGDLSPDVSDLIDKLGQPCAPRTILGLINSYFVSRYGFNDKCVIINFVGDNPASLIGMGLQMNEIAISLGTSDTLFIWSDLIADTGKFGHVFCNALKSDSYITLLCYKNGSKTRERVSKENSESNWNLFNELLDSTPRGNFGNIGFYFDEVEIYPKITNLGDFKFNVLNQQVQKFSKEVEVRACVESQFMRLRNHCNELGFKLNPDSRILATGGASINQSLLQVMADVFNTPVYVQDGKPNSAAAGAAYLARYSLTDNEDELEKLTQKVADGFKLAATPAKDAEAVYTAMLARYKILEQIISQK